MTRIDELLTEILNAAADSGLSKRMIAKRGKIHPNALHSFTFAADGKTPLWSPSVSTIRRFEAALLPPRPSINGTRKKRKPKRQTITKM